MVPGLWMVLPIIPLFLVGTTVAAYSLDSDYKDALFKGAVAAAILWGVLGWSARNLTGPATANPRTWEEFQGRVKAYKRRLSSAAERLKDCDPIVLIALDEARAQICHIEHLSRQKDTRWARALGYVNLWQALHDAEEALIEACSHEALAGGLLDELRLDGSNFSRKEELSERIRLALPVLGDATVSTYFIKPARERSGPAPNSGRTARRVLRDVRDTFNTWQDDRYGALARTRNNLLTQITAVGLAIYVLLALAILSTGNNDQEAIQAAASFLVVGATVGLMASWAGKKASDKTIEDFGLARAQLLQAFVLSGVAGFLGAMLYLVAPAMIGLNLTPDAVGSGGVIPTASLTPTPGSTEGATATPTLEPSPSLSSAARPSSNQGSVFPRSNGQAAALAEIVTQTPSTTVVPTSTISSGPKLEATESVASTSDSALLCPKPDAGETPILRCIFRFGGGSIMIAWAFAAAFGLAPDRMFNLLNRQTQQFKDDIQSAKSPESS